MSTRERSVYRLLMLLGAASLIAFYAWWCRPEHLPRNGSGRDHAWDVLIFVVLTGVLSHRIFMDAYAWVVVRKIEPLRPQPLPEPGLKVAFITTFVPGAEGIDLLMRTLPAMMAADYPHDVWLLDEGDDPEARELCANLGVHYFTRHGVVEYNRSLGPFAQRTKGGNHNSWYDAHGHAYDVVAQIDTDFPPRRDFLVQTLGHFADPKIAWVTTPQIYGNTKRFVARGAAEQQFTFYGPVLRGLSARGMTNMLGANHVVRVAALRDIGYYAGHITEDLLTGMRLHARGWRSAYVPLPLAVGEGPDTWKAYFNQQHRWAYGNVEVLQNHTRRLTRTMPRTWRLLYLALQQGYFSGIVGIAGMTLLALYFLGGVQISHIPLTGLLVWATPMFVMRHAIRLWLQRFNVRPEQERGLQLAGSFVAVAAWPVYFLATWRAFNGQALTFQVTPKGAVRKAKAGARSVFRPHMGLALVSLACLAGAVAFDRTSPTLVFWAAVNLVLLGGLWLAPERIAAIPTTRSASPALEAVVPLPRTLDTAGAATDQLGQLLPFTAPQRGDTVGGAAAV